MHDDPFVIRKTCMTGECLSCALRICVIFFLFHTHLSFLTLMFTNINNIPLNIFNHLSG